LVQLFIKEFGPCKLLEFPGRNNKPGGVREIGLKNGEKPGENSNVAR